MKPTLTPQGGDVDTSMANMASNLTMGTAAAPQVAPPCWGAPMVNVVCVFSMEWRRMAATDKAQQQSQTAFI